ncbi:E3 ubiquitin-protein ligase TTC3-like isoform X2 [Palaemon carinicauda]|uniref:E3 ubiquitin-protein ligase TTC3-like isoform X2 n=1 Tax=Palaemon carinicauda TaxID=392227 RepID=UPI0035B5F5FC
MASIASLRAELKSLKESKQRLSDQSSKLKSKYEVVCSTSKQEIERLKQQLKIVNSDVEALHEEKSSTLAARKLNVKKSRQYLSEGKDRIKEYQQSLISLEQKISYGEEETKNKIVQLEKQRQINVELLQNTQSFKQELLKASERAQEAEKKFLEVKIMLIGKQIDSMIGKQTKVVLRLRYLLQKATDDSFPRQKYISDCIRLLDENIKTLNEKKQKLLEEGSQFLGLIARGRPLNCLPDLNISISESLEMNVISFLNIIINSKEENGTGIGEILVCTSEAVPSTVTASSSSADALPPSLFADDPGNEKVKNISSPSQEHERDILDSQMKRLVLHDKLREQAINSGDKLGAEHVIHPTEGKPRLKFNGKSKQQTNSPVKNWTNSTNDLILDLCKRRLGNCITESDIKRAVDEVRFKNNNSFLGLNLDTILEKVQLQLKLRAPTELRSKAPWADLTQGEAAPLPKCSKWKDLESNESSLEVCSICLEGFYGYKTLTLDCNHVFHKICIKDWLKRQSNCPNCRTYFIVEEEYPHLSRK